jgi:hypothetical protein
VTPVAVVLSCSAEQRTELMNLARSRSAEARLVEHATMVLACLDGQRNAEVARAWGAAKSGRSVAHTLCGEGYGRAARSAAAR